MRRFSSYGPVDKDLHYYVPRESLVQKACSELKGDGPETNVIVTPVLVATEA